MTAGLPGAGIGGLFYLLAALAAPLCEVGRALRRTDATQQWARALRHFVLSASIVLAMWLVAWCTGAALAWAAGMGTGGDAGALIDSAYPQALGRNVALFTATTLVAVLLGVEALRLIVRGRRRRSVIGPDAPRTRGAIAARTIAGVDDLV